MTFPFSKLYTLLKYSISIYLIIVLFVPQGEVFNPGVEGQWETYNGIDNFESAILYVPIVVLWFVYILLGKFKRLIKAILLMLSFFVGFSSFAACVIPTQDLLPLDGAILSLGILPLFIIFRYVENKHRKNSIHESSSNS